MNVVKLLKGTIKGVAGFGIMIVGGMLLDNLSAKTDEYIDKTVDEYVDMANNGGKGLFSKDSNKEEA